MSGDTVKLMGYTSQLGTIKAGIFGSQHEEKDGEKQNEAGWNDADFKGHETKGWCAGMGAKPAIVTKDYVNFMSTRCATWKPRLKG